MAADANIFAQYLRPVRSVQDYSNDMDAAEQNKLTLAASRMKAQQDQQGMADDNALRSAYQQSGGDPTKYRNALIRLGNSKAVQAFDVADLEAQGKRTTIEKTSAETDEKRFKLAKERRDAYEQARGGLERDRALTKDKVVGVISGMVDYGMIPAELAQKLTANLPDDPEALRADIRSGNLSRLTPEQMVTLFTPKIEYQDSGQQRIPVQMNMNVPGAVAPQTIQKVATPGEVMTDQRTRSEGAANRGVQMRGQNLVDSRARDTAARADGSAVAEAGGPSQAAFNKQFGKAPAGYRWMADGNAEAIPGGPADLKNNAATVAKVTDAQDVLSLLDQAEPLLDKSTGSYLGAAIDEAGRAVGGATDGARAAAQLRALEGALISKMPKMSGPQSDKDVLLYKQMAGQIGDRTIPAEQKRAAMQTIREINSRHAGGVKPASVMSPEDTQAREWATKNPNDPRAKQIMQRLGGG